MWSVLVLPEAEDELDLLPNREQAAILEAIAKLELLGDQLGAPHSSNVEGTSSYLRELRPRRGASRWRALYRRIGSEIVIGAISPEATVNRRGFQRAVNAANERLDAYAQGGEKRNE